MKDFENLEELSHIEMKNLNGGETGWYYLGKFVGGLVKLCQSVTITHGHCMTGGVNK